MPERYHRRTAHPAALRLRNNSPPAAVFPIPPTASYHRSMHPPSPKSLPLLLGLLVALPAAGSDPFVDRAAETGLDFVHFNGMSGGLYFSEMMGQGLALLDYDADGDLDVYMLQGTMLGEGKGVEDATFPPEHPPPLSDRLYRNDLEVRPDGTRVLRFTDVTEESGIAELATGYGMGAAAADYDNDGWIDLYLTNHGPNQMLRNRGPDGEGRVTFEDVTEETGTGDPLWGVPAVFFDYDADGWLDLFVGNYVEYRVATDKPCYSPAGARDYCGPAAYPPEPDRLFRNLGGSPGAVRFEETTAKAGLAGSYGAALGATAGDFDGDGRIDLYVANDGMANQLWLNRSEGGEGRFSDEALLGGCAVNQEGQPEASMGVVAEDFDADGDLDLFMTHLERETNTLYLNDGTGLFEDRSQESGLAAPSWSATGFGVALIDYDNDGRRDLFVANGAVTLLWEQVADGETYALRQPNQLYRNVGDGPHDVRYREVTAEAGEVFGLSEVSRGVAMGDLDNDGDSDLVVANNAGPVRLLVNRVGQDRSWLGVRAATEVRGGALRDALGARVELVRPGAPSVWRLVRTDGSYASSNDPRVLFGLGSDAAGGGGRIVRVHWPGGRVEQWSGVPVGEYTTLVEGSGSPVGAGAE